MLAAVVLGLKLIPALYLFVIDCQINLRSFRALEGFEFYSRLRPYKKKGVKIEDITTSATIE